MTLTLADGRVLDYRTSGPDDGFPMVFHHGTPGSLMSFRALERAAHANGFRFVTFSRAGYGGSDRRAGRRIADVKGDVTELTAHLGIGAFATVGWSGGGPHALATAALLGERVPAALTIAGVAPYDAEGLDYLADTGEQNVEETRLALEGEAALRPVVEADAAGLRDATPADLVREMSTLLSPADVEQIDGEFAEDLVANMAEGFRSGVDGYVDDSLAFVAPWGFTMADVQVPTFVWQGDQDLMVPFAHGRWLADHLPAARDRLEPGQGHLTLAVGAVDRMFAELAAAVR